MIKARGGGKPTFQILKLPAAKAESLLTPFLSDLPSPWAKGWDTWTLAMVEDIDAVAVAQALKIGILQRMIKTALPVSARFEVRLEKDVVPKREIPPANIDVSVDVINPKFRTYLAAALKSYWAGVLQEEEDVVPKARYDLSVVSVSNPEDISQKVKALVVPGLGPVIGEAISCKTSLIREKLEERGYYDHGFAVSAYGKLINPEDPLFGVAQLSHKYWSRFLARVEIPGLDKVLLVQRNAVSENSPEARVSREVLRALFNYVRARVGELEDQPDYDPGSFGQRLTSSAPILAQGALKGLLRGRVEPDDLQNLQIAFGTFGAPAPAARFDEKTKAILINVDHPLLTSMDELGALSIPMRRVMGEVLGGIEVSKGYLQMQGVADPIVADMGSLLDASLRSAAGFVRDEVEQHIQDIEAASYEGDTEFEKTVVHAFRSLHLAATHLGDSDSPDGAIEIPRAGQENLRISVEAKGSKGVITHEDLKEATVTRHRTELEPPCQHAIAIAREFQKGGVGGKPSALLRETKGKVPLLTTEAIALMLRLHKKRNFTYEKVAQILTTWKHPDEILTFIEATWRQMPALGLMRQILDVAHKIQEEDPTNHPDPGMILADPRIRAKKITRVEVIQVLLSVQLTTRMLTILDQSIYSFELNAPVQAILDAMQASELATQ